MSVFVLYITLTWPWGAVTIATPHEFRVWGVCAVAGMTWKAEATATPLREFECREERKA